VTEDERREAEQLAELEYAKVAISRKVHTWSEGFVKGYAACFEAKRVEVANLTASNHLIYAELESERTRAARLIEQINLSTDSTDCAEDIRYGVTESIAEYEASK
jgi:hypothetical protein